MKLFYFNVKGRPEPAKLCMKLAGKEFEDVQFDGASWMSKYKALSPTGQAPIASPTAVVLELLTLTCSVLTRQERTGRFYFM